MTPTAAAALALALLAAMLDLAAPVGPTPSVARRLLRAAPAAALAVALRVSGAPPLPALALFAFAMADALAVDGREPGVGGWTAALLALLLLAAAVWELASPALLRHAPWRAGGAVAVAAGGVALWRSGRRPRGELAALAPVAVLLLAAAAAGAGAQPSPSLTAGFAAAVMLWATAAALAWARRPQLGAARAERLLRSAAALSLAAPLLPWPR